MNRSKSILFYSKIAHYSVMGHNQEPTNVQYLYWKISHLGGFASGPSVVPERSTACG
jgi:hypothetical protein